MLLIVGMIVLFGSVISGYVLHHGNIMVLYQPTEYLIIIGAAIGSAIIGNPGDHLIMTLKSFKNFFKVKPYKKPDYLEMLKFSFQIFKLMKSKGMLAVESHIENPHESEIFKIAPSIVSNHHLVEFLCDYLRLMTLGVDDSHIYEDLFEREIEVLKHEYLVPHKVLHSLGESFPAIGIVAAVLGVIITMGSITEPPEILGGLIGAALVGTFLGVLLAYGLVLPFAVFQEKFAEAKIHYLECLKAGFVAHLQGNAPTVTVEFIRKVIPEDVRHTFQEAEAYIQN